MQIIKLLLLGIIAVSDILCPKIYVQSQRTPKGDVEDGGGVIVGGEVYINYVHQK